MCGIAGVWDPDGQGAGADPGELAAAMAARLAHRGPDDDGAWSDPPAGIGLGHRRLAVRDLTPAGHQPMVSADGRWVLVYNGECYNTAEVAAELGPRAAHLRGHCDTEVVLEAIAAWGVRAALGRLNAMFALGVWDRRDRTLYLARDRLGEKPLYYSLAGRRVLFASELRGLLAHPRFAPEVDREAVGALLRLSYVPAPMTIYAGARKLAAGTLVQLRAGQGGWPEPERWWDFPDVARQAVAARPAGDATAGDATAGDATAGDFPPGAVGDLVDALDRLLADAVARRLVADVPLGAFLSGGLDSTLVTALAQARSGAPLRTFTIGFGGHGSDESAHAAAVARHLGTDHTPIDLTPAEALAAVPALARCWDEPFADPSQLPTLVLCQQVRRHLTVALSGDGGDETFGGYRRYTAGDALARRVLPLPGGLRRAAAAAIGAVPPAGWDGLGRLAARASPRLALPDLSTRAAKLARLLPSDSVRELYASLVSAWDDPSPVLAGGAPPAAWPGPPELAGLDSALDAMMAWDTLSVLPDDMLVKVDRASMSVGLEVRVPLLDHRVVSAAWALPADLRVAGGRGKQALRMVLDRYVPRRLVERPKAGFDPPLGDWLRGPLRGWAEDLLGEPRLRSEGYLDPAPVRARWADHLAGRSRQDYAIWAVLMFEAWLDAQRGQG